MSRKTLRGFRGGFMTDRIGVGHPPAMDAESKLEHPNSGPGPVAPATPAKNFAATVAPIPAHQAKVGRLGRAMAVRNSSVPWQNDCCPSIHFWPATRRRKMNPPSMIQDHRP